MQELSNLVYDRLYEQIEGLCVLAEGPGRLNEIEVGEHTRDDGE